MAGFADYDFGDVVRIRPSTITDAKGLTGLTGDVYGVTSPSCADSTGVTDILGNVTNDVAINVNLEGKGQFWFAEELVELVSHGEGAEITIGGKKIVKQANGEWEIDSPWKKIKKWLKI